MCHSIVDISMCCYVSSNIDVLKANNKLKKQNEINKKKRNINMNFIEIPILSYYETGQLMKNLEKVYLEQNDECFKKIK